MAKVSVGTGSRGGVLVRDTRTGRTTEVFQSRPDQLSDPGRTRSNRRGGSSDKAAAERAAEEARVAAQIKAQLAEKARVDLAERRAKQARDKALKDGLRIRARRLNNIKKSLSVQSKRISKNIDNLLDKTSKNLQTAKERVRANKVSGKTNRLVGEAAGFQFALSQGAVSTARAIKSLPKFAGKVYELRKKPKRDKFIKEVKKFADKEFKKVKTLKDPKVRRFVKTELDKKVRSAERFAKNNPGEIVGFVAGEILLMKGAGKVIKGSKKGLDKVLDINTVKVVTKNGKKVVQVKKKPSLLTGKATRGNRKGGKIVEFEVGGVKEGAESLSKAAKRAGTKAKAVSAQADEIRRFEKNLFNKIRKRAVVRKPLPLNVEAGLSKKTLLLLKQFDKGKLSLKKVILLNKRIRRESLKIKGVKGVQPKGIDLLERSTYFDPDRLLRSSRLAVDTTKEGRLRDLIRPGLLKSKRTRGNLRGGEIFEPKATLFPGRKPKPNLLFAEEVIEAFPKTKEFKKILKKLKSNKPLNKNELARLTQFQVTPSGKLKPIGSTTFAGGIEREVTVAAGDIIKFQKRLGTLSYKGQRIPINQVKIIKGKVRKKGLTLIEKRIKKLKDKLKKTKTKKQKSVVRKQIKSSERKLVVKKQKKVKKKLKKDIKRSRVTTRRRRPTSRKRVVPVKRKALALASRGLRKGAKRTGKRGKGITRPGTRPKGRPTGRPTPRPKPTDRPKTTTRPTPTGRPTPNKTPPTKNPPKIFPRIPKGFKKQQLKKEVEGYYIAVKKKGKLVKLNARPLKINDAKDYLAYTLDNNLARTAFFVPAGRTGIVVKLPPKMKGYFSRKRNKLRPHKIKQRKKKALLRGYIEKTKHIVDTKGEKRQLRRSINKKKTARRKKK